MIYAIHNGRTHDDERVHFVEAPLDFRTYFDDVFLPWAAQNRNKFDVDLPSIVFEAVLAKWGPDHPRPMKPAEWLDVVVFKVLEGAPPYAEGKITRKTPAARPLD